MVLEFEGNSKCDMRNRRLIKAPKRRKKVDEANDIKEKILTVSHRYI